MASDTIHSVCRKLDYTALKEEQIRVVTSFLKGVDVLGILPTEFRSHCALLPYL